MPTIQRRRNAIKSHTRELKAGYLRFKVIFAYNGTSFCGFQAQENRSNTVQEVIEFKLSNLIRRKVCIFSSGRTDKGVHASGAVFHFDVHPEEILFGGNCDIERFKQILFSTLTKSNDPQKTVKVVSIEQVNQYFDAKFSALSKTYQYKMLFGSASVYFSPFCWEISNLQLKKASVIKKLENFSNFLSGIHNFSWLCQNPESECREFVREVSIEVQDIDLSTSLHLRELILSKGTSENSFLIHINVSCDFFLYKMVRRIVGLLYSLLTEKVDLETVQNIMKEFDKNPQDKQIKQRLQYYINKYSHTDNTSLYLSYLLHTAPSKGLHLKNVQY
eukprot:snap_masked-scaffold_36-processed-gene-2.46-mRNA-1 protein AED:1.00 eAED:1.00 QI:0/0/0/0/1/1/2/0/331